MKRLLIITVWMWAAIQTFAQQGPALKESDRYFQNDYSFFITDVEMSEAMLYDGCIYDGYRKGVWCDCITKFTEENVAIPSEVIGTGGKAYSVTSMADYTFYANAGCKYVTLPESLTSIGNYCFYNNSMLESVSFGSNLRNIPALSVSYLPALKTLVLPASLTGVEMYACRDLGIETLTLNEGLCRIGMESFCNLPNLMEVTLPNSLWTMAKNFNACASLKKVTIQNLRIPLSQCFNECPNIEEVTIGKDCVAFDFESLKTSFLNIDKEKCVFRVPQGTKGITAARQEGYRIEIVSALNSGIASTLTEPTDSEVLFDLSGRKLNKDNDAPIYIQHNRLKLR